MTLFELNNFRLLNEQLLESRELLYRLKAKMEPGSPSLDGMPHASGAGDRIGSLAIEIVELEARIKCMEESCLEGTEEVKEFIESIQDPQTRLIFRLRFIRCFTWAEVAAVMGGYVTEDAVKKICYRYLYPDEN